MKRLISMFLVVLLVSAGAYAQSTASTQDNEALRKELEQLKKTMAALEERLAATEQKAAQPNTTNRHRAAESQATSFSPQDDQNRVLRKAKRQTRDS